MKLTPALARMLALVEATPDITCAKLAAGLSITAAGASKKIAPLVKAGYIHQEIGIDRRDRLLTLTKTGQSALATTRPESTDSGFTPGRKI